MGMFACGPWTVELRGDELADIRYGGLPVLRGIRAVVRNRNWLTLTPSVMSCVVQENAGSLEVVLDIEWEGYADRYAGRVSVMLNGASLTVSFEGTAVAGFASNRIGLVVLHRPDDAGRAVTVTSPSGVLTESAFPELISAHQPFVDIAALSWERDGVAYHLDFAGDVFETEDQRNWTDASFKTYGTPLSRPFPVTHREGDTVSQSIRLSARRVVLVRGDSVGTVPELGTSAGQSVLGGWAERLPAEFGPLLAEIAVESPPGSGTASVTTAVELAERLGVALDARIVASSTADAVELLRSLPIERVVRLGVFSTDSHVTEANVWDAVMAEAREMNYDGELIAGARGHFTELNRNPGSAVAGAGAVTYSITPQMHASEPVAIMETLAMQTLTAREAAKISSGRPLHIGPVTLSPRFNAVATDALRPEELSAADPQPDSLFAAAWLLGSVTALTGSGTASISYGTAAGLNSEAGQLLQRLAVLRGLEVLATDAEPTAAAVYPVQTPGGVLAFVGNLSGSQAALRLFAPSGSPLDLELAPWQTAVVQLP